MTEIWQRHPWMKPGAVIPQEMVEKFIKSSAWWLTHPSGPVRAPGHANNIYHSNLGWAVDFGANTFLVELAISRCRNSLNSFLGQIERKDHASLSVVKDKLMEDISGAVANYDGEEYEGYYPLSGTDMTFGAQSIDVKDGAEFIIESSSTRKFFIG